jgi:hypothetical protein
MGKLKIGSSKIKENKSKLLLYQISYGNEKLKLYDVKYISEIFGKINHKFDSYNEKM